jgi:uncharacterized membrane protein
MAKKRRLVEKEKEDEYEFVPPEFDEKEFILKDLYGTKILLVVALLSIVIGILCSCVQRAFPDFGLYLGLLLLFLSTAALKPILKLLRFDSDLIDQKTMIGNYIMFLLLGLGVWILFVNPPFLG